jgi:HlyD family secretion protein
LFRTGQQWALYVVEGGQVHLRTVTVGQRSGRDAQIVSGVDEGATIVLYPPDTLSDGARVALRQTR